MSPLYSKGLGAMSSQSILIAGVVLTGLALTACAHDGTRGQHGTMSGSTMECKHMHDGKDKTVAEKTAPQAESRSTDHMKAGCGMMGKGKAEGPAKGDPHADHQ